MVFEDDRARFLAHLLAKTEAAYCPAVRPATPIVDENGWTVIGNLRAVHRHLSETGKQRITNMHNTSNFQDVVTQQHYVSSHGMLTARAMLCFASHECF